MKTFILFLTLFVCVQSSSLSFSQESNDSFSAAKKMLERHVYLNDEERKTIYCDANFFADKSIRLPQGFFTQKHKNRSNKIEWEHVVPAENFGKTFAEWREGDELCADRKGKNFKGRKCAEKVNMEYRYMQADMYNLYPAIGSVNAGRSNYNFAVLPGEVSDYGQCDFEIDSRKAEPPEYSRGKIARTYLYMEKEYSQYSMSKAQKQLMSAWNTQYPVTKDECTRTRRIESIQKNENPFVKTQCLANNLW